MNSLNSVLIEGKLVADPKKRVKDEKVTFTITSRRVIKQQDALITTNSQFEIIIDHFNLAQSCLEHLQKDRGVRVVGRLVQEEDGYVRIIGDHVEFRPMKKISG